MELGSGDRGTPAGGLGVGVTGPSLPYGLDSTENRDIDGDCGRAGLS